MPEIYMIFVRKIFSPIIFCGGGNPLTRRLLRLRILCATTLRPLFSLQTEICSGTSEDTPGDAKCVTEILGRGSKIRKLGAQSLNLVS